MDMEISRYRTVPESGEKRRGESIEQNMRKRGIEMLRNNVKRDKKEEENVGREVYVDLL